LSEGTMAQVGPVTKKPELTDSAEKRLERKRHAARIRQQRCRARKRAAAAAAAQKKQFHSGGSKSGTCGDEDSSSQGSHSPPISSKRTRTSLAYPTPTVHHPHLHNTVLRTPVNGRSQPIAKMTNSDDGTPLPYQSGNGHSGGNGHPHFHYMPWAFPPHHPHHTAAHAGGPPHNPWMPMHTQPQLMPGYPQPHHQQQAPHPIPPSAQTTANSSKEKVSMTPVSSRTSDARIQPVTTTPKQSPLQFTTLPFTSPLLPTPNMQLSIGRLGFSSTLPTTTPIKASKDLEKDVYSYESDLVV